MIENTENSVYVSKVSLWEMAIKIGLGKLEMSIPFDELEVYLGPNIPNIPACPLNLLFWFLLVRVVAHGSIVDLSFHFR